MLNCAAVVQGALHTLNSPLALPILGCRVIHQLWLCRVVCTPLAFADTGLQGDLLLSVQHEESYKAYRVYFSDLLRINTNKELLEVI